MSALPIVRFRLQTSDGPRWWRADCDWTQPAPNLLRLSVDAIDAERGATSRTQWLVEAARERLERVGETQNAPAEAEASSSQ